MDKKRALEKKLANHPSLRKFVESTDNDKVSRHISMAYLLHSIANELTEEANEVLHKYGLVHFSIKYHSNRLQKAFDLYHRQIYNLIDGGGREAFIKDYEYFREIVESFMNSKK